MPFGRAAATLLSGASMQADAVLNAHMSIMTAMAVNCR